MLHFRRIQTSGGTGPLKLGQPVIEARWQYPRGTGMMRVPVLPMQSRT